MDHNQSVTQSRGQDLTRQADRQTGEQSVVVTRG